jgi:hypothetical protein
MVPKPTPVYHITPQNDLYRHELDRDGECWCCPEIDHDEFDVTYIHHSYDCREAYEDGRRKPH